MIKLRLLALVAVAAVSASSAIAGGIDACCAKHAANETASAKCVSLDKLNVSADQKTKLTAWQDECIEAGCTKESHATFLKQAKGILSPEQYTALEKECGSMHGGMHS